MTRPIAVVFDIGNVLYDWDPKVLYRRLISDDEALDVFLRDVCSKEWHFQHDAGRPFADTSAELSARFPQHAELIAQWGPRFSEQIPGPVEGMSELVAELDEAGVPLFAITNFSDEFFQPFRTQEAAMFDRFRDIVVSGAERLVKPDAGRIMLDGADITGLPMYRRAVLGLGYLPQETSIFRGMTVEKNILAVLELAEPDRAAREKRLDQLLDEFGLTRLRASPAMALSGGERRRDHATDHQPHDHRPVLQKFLAQPDQEPDRRGHRHQELRRAHRADDRPRRRLAL